jgi:hypothetical protein
MEQISAITALCSSIAAFITIIVTVKNARKKDFIGVVTKARSEYIQNLRSLIAEYCHLSTSPNQSQDDIKRLNHLKYLIYLHLNPSEEDRWDWQIVDLVMDKIPNNPNSLLNNINKLLKISESLFELEWKGLTLEGTNGILTQVQKHALRNKLWKKL